MQRWRPAVTQRATPESLKRAHRRLGGSSRRLGVKWCGPGREPRLERVFSGIARTGQARR